MCNSVGLPRRCSEEIDLALLSGMTGAVGVTLFSSVMLTIVYGQETVLYMAETRYRKTKLKFIAHLSIFLSIHKKKPYLKMKKIKKSPYTIAKRNYQRTHTHICIPHLVNKLTTN